MFVEYSNFTQNKNIKKGRKKERNILICKKFLLLQK